MHALRQRTAGAKNLQTNPENRTILPKMAFTGYASRYRQPKLLEGFTDITTVDFKVSTAKRRMNSKCADPFGSWMAPKSRSKYGASIGFSRIDLRTESGFIPSARKEDAYDARCKDRTGSCNWRQRFTNGKDRTDGLQGWYVLASAYTLLRCSEIQEPKLILSTKHYQPNMIAVPRRG
jgi:hypothetical protein